VWTLAKFDKLKPLSIKIFKVVGPIQVSLTWKKENRKEKKDG
jgi:hypothetical protein